MNSSSDSSSSPSVNTPGNTAAGLSPAQRLALLHERIKQRDAARLSQEVQQLAAAGGGPTPQDPQKPGPWKSTHEVPQAPQKALDFNQTFGFFNPDQQFNVAEIKASLPSDDKKANLVAEPDAPEVNEVNPLGIATRDELPSELKYHEDQLRQWQNVLDSIKAVEMQAMKSDLVHRDYRRADRPIGFLTKPSRDKFRRGKLNPATYKNVAVSIWDQNDQSLYLLGDTEPVSAGSTEGNIQARFMYDSQMPYMQFKLANIFGLGHVFVYIHANHISKTHKKPFWGATGQDMAYRKKKFLQELPMIKHIVAACRQNLLTEFKLVLHTAKELEESKSEYGAPIVAGGATQALWDDLMERFLETEGKGMSNSEVFLAALGCGYVENMSIYVGFRDKEGDRAKMERLQWANFVKYFSTTMLLALHLGNFWAIRTQIRDIDWLHHEFPFDKTNAPRWLVTKWGPDVQGTRDLAEDAELAFFPEQVAWTSFAAPLMWPSPNEKLFTLRLGVNRERQFQHKYNTKLFEANKGQIKAKFRADPTDDKNYIVELKTDIDRGKLGSNLPGADTRLSVNVEGIVFHGKVVDVPKTKFGGDFSAFVVCSKSTRLGNKVYDATVEFKDDSTTFVRAMMALGRVEKDPPNRKRGVHIRNLVLGAKVPKDQEPITVDQAVVATYQRMLSEQLDNDQREACMTFLLDPRGVFNMYGPPGTGKTLTITNMIFAFLEIDGTMIVCAPTNEAVLELAGKWLAAITGTTWDGLWCIWKGSYLKHGLKQKSQARLTGKVPHLETETEMVARQTDESLWKLMAQETMKATGTNDDKWAKHGFALRRWQRIQAIRQMTNHPLQQQAEEYCELLKDFFSLDTRAKNKLLAHEDSFTKEYLAICRVVFTTCNSSWSEDLHEYFKPTAAIVDEAGAATAVDILIPLVGFQDTIERVVLCGDPKQQPPVVTSLTCNEAFRTIKSSIFQALVDESGQGSRADERFAVRMLKTQYRMHPDIAAWPNKQFYGNKLINASVTQAPNSLRATVDEFMLRTREYFEGDRQRYRVAVDISGKGRWQSRTFGKGTSLCNDTEASFVTSTIVELLRFEPKKPGTRKITSADIIVVTPYTGQRRLIQQMLAEVDVMLPHARFVTSYTTNNVQGREGGIEFISLVQNDFEKPGNIGFIYGVTQLNIELTRARCFQVIVGNFWNWLLAIQRGQDPFERSSHKAFASLLQDLSEKNDIITAEDFIRMFRTNTALPRDLGQFPREFKKATKRKADRE